MNIFNSEAFKIKRYVVIPKEREIKTVEEVEHILNDVVFYTTDGKSYGISQVSSLEETLERERNERG